MSLQKKSTGKIRISLLGGLLFFSSLGEATETEIKPKMATGIESLTQFFQQLTTYTADFVQTVQGAQLNMADKSSGTLVIQRPGQFRWHYTQPYLQEIIADGTQVWIYDADLEQVTIKPFDAMLGQTPALLLSGVRPLETAFTFEELPLRGHLSWVALKSKQAEASFTAIHLGFADNLLQAMELFDNLGQKTILTFSNIQWNITLDNNTFTFVVPAGADVFDTRTQDRELMIGD